MSKLTRVMKYMNNSQDDFWIDNHDPSEKDKSDLEYPSSSDDEKITEFNRRVRVPEADEVKAKDSDEDLLLNYKESDKPDLGVWIDVEQDKVDARMEWEDNLSGADAVAEVFRYVSQEVDGPDWQRGEVTFDPKPSSSSESEYELTGKIEGVDPADLANPNV